MDEVSRVWVVYLNHDDYSSSQWELVGVYADRASADAAAKGYVEGQSYRRWNAEDVVVEEVTVGDHHWRAVRDREAEEVRAYQARAEAELAAKRRAEEETRLKRAKIAREAAVVRLEEATALARETSSRAREASDSFGSLGAILTSSDLSPDDLELASAMLQDVIMCHRRATLTHWRESKPALARRTNAYADKLRDVPGTDSCVALIRAALSDP